MLRYALYGLQVGLLSGACYWYMDTLVMFFVLAWKMSNPSSGLVSESLWLLLGSLAVFGGLGAVIGAILSIPYTRLDVPHPEQALGKFKSSGLFKAIARGPLMGLNNWERAFPLVVALLILLPMHVLVFLVSPEVDDIMGVGFLILHMGFALSMFLSVVWLAKPSLVFVVVLAMMGGWVNFQNKGAIQAWMAQDDSAEVDTRPIPEGKPNIVFIVADTTRLDHLSAYGYDRDTTPFIKDAAAEGVRFDNATSTAPWTLASHAGMFSGMHSSRSHANHQTLHLSFEYTTLAEGLDAAGYNSELFAGNPWLQDFTGLAQGFEGVYPSWRAYTISQLFVLGRAYLQYSGIEEDKGGAASNKKAKEWLSEQANTERPFFLFFNYLEPHAPYHQIPDRHAMMYQEGGTSLAEVDQISRNIMSDMMFSTGYVADDAALEIALATYDGGIRYTDELIEDLVKMIDARGELDNTLFVFAADHGELFGKDGIWGHELSLDEKLIHVPLIMWGAGINKAAVIKDPVQLSDLLPTLLEAVGEGDKVPEESEGESLWPLIQGTGPAFSEARPVVAEYYTPTHPSLLVTAEKLGMDPKALDIKAIKMGPLKYVVGPGDKTALYDLSTDPDERVDLSDTRYEEKDLLAMELERFIANSEAGGLGGEGGAMPEMDAATLERLKALGYIGD